MAAHTANGFDSWVVLKALVKEITDLKNIKTARGLISSSFRPGVKKVKTVEVPQNAKITLSKSRMKGFSEKKGREYGHSQRFSREKLNIRSILRGNFANLRQKWELYLKLDLFVFIFYLC